VVEPGGERTTVGGVALPHVRLSEGAHDRIAVRRRDEAWLDRQWADPESRVLVVSGTRVRPVDGAIAWVSPADAPDGTRLLLGEQDGRTWFAVVTGPEAAQEADAEWFPLRALLPGLVTQTTEVSSMAEAPLVFHAVGLAEWLWATRFCPRCAEPLTPRSAGHELACVNGHVQFPRSDPAVIMLITSGDPGAEDERCLLGRNPRWPEGRYSTLAGFCEPGETLEDAVRREVLEESGVVVGEVAYFGNQPWPLPASLMLGFTGRATSVEITTDDDEIEDARWVTRAEMKAGAESGSLVLPGGISISRSLIESWYGGTLPGSW
jgi:NAD+ diphosphatase